MRHATEIPNLRHLFAIAEVASQGSVARAAQAINLSQPAVTQGLKKVESQIGLQLFERTPIGMTATPAGQILAARIERAKALIAQGSRLIAAKAPLHQVATTVQLRALISVVEHKGFSQAARHLALAEPSVHRAVRDLETLCGRALVTNGPQGVEPTRDARSLARAGALAFAEIRQGLDELREQIGIMDGRLWIGSLPLAMSYLLPTAVTQLLKIYPDAKIRLVDGPYDEMLHELRHGELDMMIGALRFPLPANDIRQEILFDDPLSIMVRAGHPILGHHPAPDVATLAQLDWIAPRSGTPARAQFESFFATQGYAPPRHIVECSSLSAMRVLLLQSERAALLSEGQVHFETQAGQLAVLQMRLPGTERSIGLTLRADWQPTAIQAHFLNLLRAIVAARESASGKTTT